MECQSCGSPSISACGICGLSICGKCMSNHQTVCAQMQQIKARGQGPTVRMFPNAVLIIPADSDDEPEILEGFDDF